MKPIALLILCFPFQVKSADSYKCAVFIPQDLPDVEMCTSVVPSRHSQKTGDADTEGSGKLVCYAELWAGERPSPGKYDLNMVPSKTCDYLILIYITLDRNTWTLRMHNGNTDVDPEDLHKASKLREKSPKMKVLVSVGGLEDGVQKYSEMMSDTSIRKAFVKSVVETVETYDLDGIELHWMYPGVIWKGGNVADKVNFIRLVEELNSVFKPRNWILTASVPPDEEKIRDGYNVPRLSNLLHQIHVRTIDLRGDWSRYASSHCPLFSSSWEKPELRDLNVNGSLSLWESLGANPRKLLPTFPFLGRSFTLRDSQKTEPGSPIRGPGESTPIVRASSMSAYFEICEGVKNGQLTRHYQSGAESPYAVRDDYWVGYEDEESLQKKVQLLTEKGNGGAAIFPISMDDFVGNCGQPHSLLHKMRQLLNESLPNFRDPRRGEKT